MDDRDFKEMRKQAKTHENCPRCGKAMRESCRYGFPVCKVQHCACEMTQGKR